MELMVEEYGAEWIDRYAEALSDLHEAEEVEGFSESSR